MRSVSIVSLALTSVVATASIVQAVPLDYYVAIDNRPDLTGYYVNYPNPNQGRLSLAWTHSYPTGYSNLTASSNHFHRIGAVSYVPPPSGTTGPLPPGQPTPPTFFSNARAPEGTRPGIRMAPGSGVFANRLVTVDEPDANVSNWSYYDNLTIGSVHNMRSAALEDPTIVAAVQAGQASWQPNGDLVWNVNPTGTGGNPARASTDIGWMYTSSTYARSAENGGGFTSRYTQLFDTSTIALELVSKSSELDITDANNVPLLTNPGDRVTLGTGRTWEFTPVFSAPLDTPEGTELTAKFRLVDTTNQVLPSGEFFFAMFVPEPVTLGLLAGASTLLLGRRRK